MSIILTAFYRPYIYTNNIYDYGLADAGYNLFAVVLISLTSWIFNLKITNNKWTDILLHTSIFIILEIVSYFFPILGTFDGLDIGALLISSLIAQWLLYTIEYKKKSNSQLGSSERTCH